MYKSSQKCKLARIKISNIINNKLIYYKTQ
jgi:hypothetical protein